MSRPAGQEDPAVMRVEPSLHWAEAFLTSERHRRLARKWPWSWRCTACDDAYGAAKTEEQAQEAADGHALNAHAVPTNSPSVPRPGRQTSPSKGDQVT